MRIALFFLSPLTNKWGGTEKVLCEMANEMVNRNHNVTIFFRERTSNKRILPDFPLDGRVELINTFGNVPLPRKIINKFVKEVGSFFCWTKCIRHSFRRRCECKIVADDLSRCFEESAYDVVILYSAFDVLVVKGTLDIHIPVVAMVHFDFDFFFRTRAYAYNSLQLCDCVQVLLDNEVSMFQNWLKNSNIICIPNVVPQYIKCCDYHSKKIITVGRINRDKQIHILLEAYYLLGLRDQKYKDWDIEIWGNVDVNDDYFMEMKQYILNHNLSETIHFMGTTRCIDEKLQQASIFAFPSAHEGFALALAEAMSMGLPAIGFQTSPGVSSLIFNGKNGVLCDCGVDSFASALAELMDDCAKRKEYGRQAKNDMKQYSSDIVWNRWENLLFELVG